LEIPTRALLKLFGIDTPAPTDPSDQFYDAHDWGLRSLLLMVAPIGLIDIYSAYQNIAVLIDLTIVWRICWICFAITMSYETSGLRLQTALVIYSVDVILPIISLMVCWKEAKLLPNRLYDLFKKARVDHRQVDNYILWVGRVGVLLSVGLSIYVISWVKQYYLQSFILAIPACYYLFYEWFAQYGDLEWHLKFVAGIQCLQFFNYATILFYFRKQTLIDFVYGQDYIPFKIMFAYAFVTGLHGLQRIGKFYSKKLGYVKKE
jgi:hypothetical protein